MTDEGALLLMVFWLAARRRAGLAAIALVILVCLLLNFASHR